MDDRLEYWLEQIASKLGELVEIGEKVFRPRGGHDSVLPPESELQAMTFGEAIQKATDHFADANKMVADEPPKKWRILEPGEVICSGDFVNTKSNLPSDPPNGFGWSPVDASIGTTVYKDEGAVFARPVAEEPEHPAGPKPDPGEGYRILSKDPPEDLQEGDEFFHSTLGRWRESIHAAWGYKRQDPVCWYRRKIETAEPAWEPKVGDWVKVTRPEGLGMGVSDSWSPSLDKFDGKVGKIESDLGGRFHICGFAWPSGLRFTFHRDWLSPAEPPASEKPPEPEYRQPVLPADAGKKCQFSDDGQRWLPGWVYGWVPDRNWVTLNNNSWKHARIRKDA